MPSGYTDHVRALACFAALVVVFGCATSEEIPPLFDLDGAVAADGGGPQGMGGTGAGGAANGGTPTMGGVPNGGASGGGNTAGSSGTCVTANCPSCSSTFGTACCTNNGTCGCKALFGLLNCM